MNGSLGKCSKFNCKGFVGHDIKYLLWKGGNYFLFIFSLHDFVFDSRSMFLYKLRQSEMSQQENTDFVAGAVRLLNKGWIRVKHMFLIIVLYLYGKEK